MYKREQARYNKLYQKFLAELKLQGMAQDRCCGQSRVTPGGRTLRLLLRLCLRYRGFFLTVYSMGLRLGEGLQLEVGNIDASRQRVHVRTSKGKKDRYVSMPEVTLQVLRGYWRIHQHPRLLCPNRKGTPAQIQKATSCMDRGGVQNGGVRSFHTTYPVPRNFADQRNCMKCGRERSVPYRTCSHDLSLFVMFFFMHSVSTV